jgi:hypothetical protein
VLKKLVEALYHKVFVSIVITRSSTTVYIEHCNNKKVLQNYEKTFETTSFNHKVYDFIIPHISETPFHYVSILDSSAIQGALPSCDPKVMALYTDVSTAKHICYNDQWSYYTSMAELDALQREYQDIGLDFIFSPFAVLAKIFKEKLDGNMSMLVLLEDNFLSLSIFHHSELLYAERMDMEHADENDELMIDDSDELDFDLEASIDLDEVSALDDLGELEDFGDIEDLDMIDDIDEFSESIEAPKQQKKLFDDMPSADSGGFDEDYQRFLLIKSSIHHFYNDDTYDSQFVEHVYIADCVGVSDDLKKYLEEEMFLNVVVRKIDLMQELCDIAKEELS